MGKKDGIVVVAVCMALIFSAGIIYAGTSVKDVIPLQSPEYGEHTKGIVQFSHKKHAGEYGASCGECHHDDKGKPLDLKEGDSVQRCIECHKEALHANCINCHKDWNKEKGFKKTDPKAAPTTCKNCHPKKEK